MIKLFSLIFNLCLATRGSSFTLPAILLKNLAQTLSAYQITSSGEILAFDDSLSLESSQQAPTRII